ncbi:MAG TPA: F0F1 ATP synthase subunit delta [Gammaproteobacteria bacterium]|nr:F0F1 ATP synthase subunit delta [Gammaproteobacteria bacterium]
MADFSTVARPYARAVFELASAAGQLREWSEGLAAAAAVLNDAAAKSFLARPELTDQQRAEFVQAICADVKGADLWRSQHGQNLLRLLVENDRLTALPGIAAQFDALKAQAENKVKVTLVSAVEVDRGVAEKVTQALQKKLGRTVELELTIDPALLGGAIIRAEDMVIDGSVRTRLQRLAENLIG